MRQANAQDMQRISAHPADALEDLSLSGPVSLQLKLPVRLCLMNLLTLQVKLLYYLKQNSNYYNKKNYVAYLRI